MKYTVQKNSKTTTTFIIQKLKQRSSDAQVFQTLALILTTGTKTFVFSCTKILKITTKPEATEPH